jgi:hypothetical protein
VPTIQASGMKDLAIEQRIVGLSVLAVLRVN